jgi:hypothetical protein
LVIPREQSKKAVKGSISQASARLAAMSLSQPETTHFFMFKKSPDYNITEYIISQRP